MQELNAKVTTEALTKDQDSPVGIKIWFKSEGFEFEFTVKGCIDVRRYFNGETPEMHNSEPDYMHFCGRDGLATTRELFREAERLAVELWRVI